MEFKDKKIALLGFGVENKSLLTWFVRQGIRDITVCDQNVKIDIPIRGAKKRLGKDYLNNLDDFDVLFRTPGISYLHPAIQKAREKGVEISSATKFFFELCPAKIIGVTGTKGKGTTASLITAILRQIHPDRQIFLAGNIGQSPFDFVSHIKPEDLVVLELSSFQLQDMDKSPHIGVILNISQDHLNYHQNEEEYIRAKKNIISHQTKDDFAVINADYFTSFDFGLAAQGEIYWFSRRKPVDQGVWLSAGEFFLRYQDTTLPLFKSADLKLIGEHNRENVAAAVATAFLTKPELAILPKIHQAVSRFQPLPHRLEFVREMKGVAFYNDSYATNPTTTAAALASFTSPIILIVGGQSKGLSWEPLIEAIVKNPVKAMVLYGQNKDELNQALSPIQDVKSLTIQKHEALPAAITQLKSLVQTGDVVLFSPASASFDQFKNATERGEEFKKLVRQIKI